MADLKPMPSWPTTLSLTAKRRLKIIEYYLQCKNKTATARQFGLSAKTVKSYVDRYNPNDLGQLEERSKERKTQPSKVAPELEQAICNLALVNPILGGTALSKLIQPPLSMVTPQMVNRVLKRHRLSTTKDRWLAVDRPGRAESIAGIMGPAGMFIRNQNGRLRDIAFRGDHPGDAIAFGVVKLGNLTGIGSVYMTCVIDSYSSAAFATLDSAGDEISAAQLIERACLFFAALNFRVNRVKVHREPFKTSTARQHIATLLELRNVLERDTAEEEKRKDQWNVFKTKQKPLPSGFVRHFYRFVKIDFFDPLDRRKTHDLASLRNAFDVWIADYNQNRQLHGYPTYGTTAQQMLGTHCPARIGVLDYT